MSSSSSMDKQSQNINDKLSQLLTKNDTSFPKYIIKDTILELKESMLAPVIKQIEIMEATLLENSLENDPLKKENVTLKFEIKTSKSTIKMEGNLTF